MPEFERRAPRSKSEFMSRILSYDFTGDLREMFPGGVNLTRMSSSSLMITSKKNPETRFLIAVHIPRTEEQLTATREKIAAKQAQQAGQAQSSTEPRKRRVRESQKPVAPQDGQTSH